MRRCTTCSRGNSAPSCRGGNPQPPPASFPRRCSVGCPQPTPAPFPCWCSHASMRRVPVPSRPPPLIDPDPPPSPLIIDLDHSPNEVIDPAMARTPKKRAVNPSPVHSVHRVHAVHYPLPPEHIGSANPLDGITLREDDVLPAGVVAAVPAALPGGVAVPSAASPLAAQGEPSQTRRDPVVPWSQPPRGVLRLPLQGRAPARPPSL